MMLLAVEWRHSHSSFKAPALFCVHEFCSEWHRDARVPPVTAETRLGTALGTALLQQGALRLWSRSSLLISHTTAWTGFILALELALWVEEQDVGFESTSSCNVDAPALCQCPAGCPKVPEHVTKLNKGVTPTLRTKMFSSVPSYHKPYLTC